ncbi:MAG: DMT family transporter [Gammaproteobacteria bacterium]|nr:DMT family transporter [Gammaproteobacteria bacterium]
MRHPHFILISFAVFFAAGIWGLYWLPQRLLLEAGMTGGWGTVAQYVISLAVLSPIALWRFLNGKQVGFQHWACGLLLGSGAIFYANSFLVTDIIRALVFFYLAPIWATLVEVLFLKRIPNWPRAVSIVLALGGVWIVVGLDVGVPLPVNLGDWFGLVAGLLIAAGAARTEIEQPQGIFPLLFIVIVFCFLSSVCQYPLLADSVGTMPTIDVAMSSLPLLVGITLLFVLPTTAILFWSPSRIGTGVFGILILSELVVGVISAALLTDEPFGWREVVGATMILLAGIVEVALSRSPELRSDYPSIVKE